MATDPRNFVKNPAAMLQGLKALEDDLKEWNATEIPDSPGFLWKLVHLDPALYRAFVVTIALLCGAFGLVVSDQSVGAIVTVVSAAIALIQGVWTRKSVTANAKVVVLKPDPVNEPSLVAPGEAVSTDAVSVLNAAGQNSTTGQVALRIEDLPPVVNQ